MSLFRGEAWTAVSEKLRAERSPALLRVETRRLQSILFLVPPFGFWGLVHHVGFWWVSEVWRGGGQEKEGREGWNEKRKGRKKERDVDERRCWFGEADEK